MSKDLVQRLQEELARERALKERALAERDSVLDYFVGDGPLRRRYEGPRDPETGRTIVTCIGCHRVGPLRARHMCASCYAKWLRRRKSR